MKKKFFIPFLVVLLVTVGVVSAYAASLNSKSDEISGSFVEIVRIFSDGTVSYAEFTDEFGITFEFFKVFDESIDLYEIAPYMWCCANAQLLTQSWREYLTVDGVRHFLGTRTVTVCTNCNAVHHNTFRPA